jgi:hypothetical protein
MLRYIFYCLLLCATPELCDIAVESSEAWGVGPCSAIQEQLDMGG